MAWLLRSIRYITAKLFFVKLFAYRLIKLNCSPQNWIIRVFLKTVTVGKSPFTSYFFFYLFKNCTYVSYRLAHFSLIALSHNRLAVERRQQTVIASALVHFLHDKKERGESKKSQGTGLQRYQKAKTEWIISSCIYTYIYIYKLKICSRCRFEISFLTGLTTILAGSFRRPFATCMFALIYAAKTFHFQLSGSSFHRTVFQFSF